MSNAINALDVPVSPNLVYFSSVSENTKRFVDKLGIEAARIPLTRNEAPLIVDAPYVLVVPTYGGEVNPETGKIDNAVPKQVIKFLNEEKNRGLIRGVISAGNRNFGEAYCAAGSIIGGKCKVPVLYRFELMGTIDDVEQVQEGLKEFWQTQQ
jgi:protein involved in ribonucleotide reduction